ncbi:MAG: ice-binding family protein [Candidatus Marinimicrobia bacterium]|nr:ice-binding family protein [Candidatus Neomarinimicrobiota bacterium]
MAENKVWSLQPYLTPGYFRHRPHSSTMPANAATDIAINSNIRANFSEAMDHATIVAANVTLKQGSTAVNGTVTYDVRNHVAIFAPAENLVSGTEYTATGDDISNGSCRQYTLPQTKFGHSRLLRADQGPAPVSLGTAGNFTLLAKTAISTVPASNITGDVGLSPAAETYITGFSLTDATGYAASPQVTGFIYAADMTPPTPTRMTTAISDMETAYTDAAGRSTPDSSVIWVPGKLADQRSPPDFIHGEAGLRQHRILRSMETQTMSGYSRSAVSLVSAVLISANVKEFGGAQAEDMSLAGRRNGNFGNNRTL